MDTFTTLWNRVQLRVAAAGPELCQDLIRDAFNQLAERRQWSWLMRTSTFFAPPISSPGTVAVTSGSAIVTGAGTAFASSLVNKQIRLGSLAGAAYPTYTILQVPSTTSLVLDRPWVGPDLTGQAYTLLLCYFPVPSDFQYFYSIICPSGNYRLNHNATQAELDSYDPQRSQSGIAYAMALYDYLPNTSGQVSPAIQIKGSGPVPVSATSGFSYPLDSIYSIEITTGGIVGTAQFGWKQDNGITQGSGVVTSGSPVSLSNGVQVYFPAGTYILGDMFVIWAKPDSTVSVPRYEMWPRPSDPTYVYPYLYACKLPSLSDDSPTLPEFIARRGDVLVEMALTNLSLWPGTADQPNPYRDPNVSMMHRQVSEKMIYELEKKDDDTGIKDLIYSDLPFAGPWRDGSWLQSHAIYPY